MTTKMIRTGHFLRASLFLAWAVWLCTNAATATSELAQAERAAAIRLYNQNQFDRAIATFTHVAQTNPRDEITQYYLGLAFARLDNQPEAYQHFKTAYLLSPNSLSGRYSWQAINRIVATNAKASADGDMAENARPAITPDAEHTAAMITIDKEAKERITLRNKDVVTQSADGLEQQIKFDRIRPGFRLIPTGTNLYVRSFAETPTVLPSELLADQEKLVVTEHHGKASAMAADQDKLLLKEKKSSADLNVSGRLLRR